ncbi:hypothetical protein CR513_60520, partial [Mucuna pruriens]
MVEAIPTKFQKGGSYGGSFPINLNANSSQDKIMVAETTQNDASPSTFTTLMAVPKTLYDPAWYTNPGATNHLILQDTNLMRATSYNGNARIKMAYGYSASI